jgi:hypothetical protein
MVTNLSEMKNVESYKYHNSCTVNISDIHFRLVNVCFVTKASEMVDEACKETNLQTITFVSETHLSKKIDITFNMRQTLEL